jgi:hypothetical protein
MDDVLVEDQNRKERSPSFPFIPLGKAVDRAGAMAVSHRKNAVRLSMIAETWGYAPASSGLQQTAAALKAFGLVEDSGRGDDRRLALSGLALRILTDTRPGAKEQALIEAALRPRLFREYSAVWLGDMPSDSHRLSELELDRGFTPAAARLFIKSFDETMSFANVTGAENASTYSLHAESGEIKVEGGAATDLVVQRAALSRPTEPKVVPSRFTEGRSGAADIPRATLPLAEGIVALEIPAELSRRSHTALKAWLELMVQLAEANVTNEKDAEG